MPKYKVKEKGFYAGKLYSPEGKRSFLFTDRPLKKVPAWLEPMKAESLTEHKKRIVTEKKTATVDKEKAKSDQKDIQDMSFMGAGEKSNNVETL